MGYKGNAFVEGEYRTMEASADFTGKMYHFVKLHTTSGQVALCTAITDKVYGVLHSVTATIGKPVKVKVYGETPVSANAAVALGAFVGPSTDSQGQTAVATQFIAGQALTAAGAAGDLFRVELIRSTLAVA
jgi:hypothetical protein